MNPKIDFFAGTHGNFLELLINLFVYRIDFDIGASQFNANGACHVKNEQKGYYPKILCHHYTFLGRTFSPRDLVIEIHCEQRDMLAAMVNSLVRSGDEVMDITHLHTGTVKKLLQLPKAKPFLDTLTQEHGIRDNYPKSLIRNYFYSKFDIAEHGLDQFNEFSHVGSKMKFPFSAFYNLEDLYYHLNQCARFLNHEFVPDLRLVTLWQDFMSCNQGYASAVRCQRIIHAVLAQQDMDMSGLNLVEEAWIMHRLIEMFRCYDHSALVNDEFLTSTKDLADAIYSWKHSSA